MWSCEHKTSLFPHLWGNWQHDISTKLLLPSIMWSCEHKTSLFPHLWGNWQHDISTKLLLPSIMWSCEHKTSLFIIYEATGNMIFQLSSYFHPSCEVVSTIHHFPPIYHSWLPSLREECEAHVFGSVVCLSGCLTQKLSLRLTWSFYTRNIMPMAQCSSKMIRIGSMGSGSGLKKRIDLIKDFSPLRDRMPWHQTSCQDCRRQNFETKWRCFAPLLDHASFQNCG